MNREEISVGLYEECYDQVAQNVFIRTINSQEAEDLASETFVRCLKNLASYQERFPMKAWFARIKSFLLNIKP